MATGMGCYVVLSYGVNMATMALAGFGLRFGLSTVQPRLA
jgi:hypothetical protein